MYFLYSAKGTLHKKMKNHVSFYEMYIYIYILIYTNRKYNIKAHFMKGMW